MISLQDEIERLLVRWIAERAAGSSLMREILSAHADQYVEVLTGYPADDWRSCRVRAERVAQEKKSTEARR